MHAASFLWSDRVADANAAAASGKALADCRRVGLRELGYVYGIIGAAGPVEFYQQAVGAT
jgi:hypothetical protein